MMTKHKSDLRKALHFMIEAHDGQFRKFSGKEYAHHPVEVAKIVRNHKQSKNKEKLLISALLHDTVEDVDHITHNVIEKHFGEMVSSIVYELTSDKEEIKRIGKSQYLLNKMLKMTSYALVIKLADRLHNCSDLENGSEKFRNNYVTETRFILNGLKDRYLSQTHRCLISKIDEKISKFE
jgi:(p)ppGpp synthase/HD superfamily hydrolase